jgi:uncharacterized phosphosugar-binding protein
MAPARSATDKYIAQLHALLQQFQETQANALDQASRLLATSLRRGGVVHLFGTGHSHMIAEEVFYRAGGLVPVVAMLDESVVLSGGALRSTETERTPGAAATIAAKYDLRAEDAGVVISNSGRNPAPVEMAQLMRQRGMPVVAITSMPHSSAVAPANPHGLRLADVADVVLDTGVAHGDAALELQGALHPVGPTSTVIGAAIVQSLILAAMEKLTAAGEQVVNLPSGNVENADSQATMAEFAKYRDRLRHL